MSSVMKSMIVVGCVLSLCAPAFADQLYSDGSLRETSHTADVRVERGFAYYRVRRTFENRGESVARLDLLVYKPMASNVTALRLFSGGVIHDGEQMPEDVAWEQFVEPSFTGTGTAHRPRALITWRPTSEFSLQAYPVLPSGEVTIEYDLVGEARYEDGTYHIGYPGAGGEAFVSPAVSLSGETSGQRVTYLGETIEPGERVMASSQEQEASDHIELSISSPTTRAEPLARYAVVHHGTQSAMQMKLELPSRLSTLPDDLHIAIVVDNSRSMELLESRESIWRVIEELGNQAPEAHFDIILSDRASRSLFPEAVQGRSLGDAIEDALTRAPLTYRNGSDLDLGIALAAERLASLGHTHRRILLLTDEVLPSHWSNARALESLGKEDFLQVVELSDDELDLQVISEPNATQFGRHVQIRGGVYFHLGLEDYDSTERDVITGLLRPTHLEHIATTHPRFTKIPARLGEGQGVTLTEYIDHHRVPDRWVMKGMLWTEPVEIIFESTAQDERLMSTLWLGDSVSHSRLTGEFEQMLASKTGALAVAHALFAIERSTSAAKHVLPLNGVGLGMRGTGGVGCGGVRLGGGRLPTPAVTFPIDEALQACASERGISSWSGDVEVTLTYHEVTGVRVQSAQPDFDVCLQEQIWAMALPREPYEDRRDARFSLLVSMSGDRVHSTPL